MISQSAVNNAIADTAATTIAGIKSTEFWLSAATIAVLSTSNLGLIHIHVSGEDAILAVVADVAYVASRTILKLAGKR